MNTPETIKMGRSRTLGARSNYYTLLLLSMQDGGTMTFNEIKEKLPTLIDYDEWESYIYPKTGQFRWVLNLQFYSVDLVKSGFMIKNKGEWAITEEGRDFLTKCKDNPTKLFKETHRRYLEWQRNNQQETAINEESAIDDIPLTVEFETIQQQADDGLRTYIENRTPYEFQDMVSALLRAMGYYTPFIAPKGKDGGVDIIAYSDPMGANQPILKVQVKHYKQQNVVPVDVVRNIIGVSQNATPVIVTSSRFTESAQVEARQNNVRLIAGSEFISLWINYYDKMNEDDKSRMPIEPVYFVKP